jgi:amino acid transporter
VTSQDNVAPAERATPRQAQRADLRHNALTGLDSVVMSVAGVAPAVGIAASTAALFGAVGHAGPASLLYCGIAVFGIVWAFNFLGRAEVNEGASYAWVRRALAPPLGYLAGWALVVSGVLAMVSLSLPAGSVTLGLFSSSLATNTALVTLVGGAFFAVMVLTVLFGIRISARAQLIMSGIEVTLLIVFGILALVHGPTASGAAFSWSWLSPGSFGGFGGTTGSFVAGALVAAFYYSGWDTNANLNEETKNARRVPGISSLIAVLLVFLLFQVFTIGTNLNLSAKTIAANSGNVLGVLGQVVWPGDGGKLIVVAVILSAVATLETSLLQGSRTLFAMGRDRTMPQAFARIHPTWRTPWIATILLGVVTLLLFALSNYVGSLSTILSDAISAIGLQICFYYGLAGLSVVVLYRRQLLKSAGNFIFIGLWPFVGAIFMFIVLGESVPSNPAAVNIAGIGTLGLGLIPLTIFWIRGSDYFKRLPRDQRVVSSPAESFGPGGTDRG